MTLRYTGLTVIASGVVLFLFGLYGLFGEFSLFLSAAGALALFVGLGILLFTLRTTKLSRPQSYAIVVTAIAIVLHSYEQWWEGGSSSDGISLAWLLWSLTPYALCLFVSAFPATRMPAVAGAVVALAFDSIAHYDVFVNPKGSTAALALVFVPLWNTIVFSPLAILIAWLVLRWRTRMGHNND